MAQGFEFDHPIDIAWCPGCGNYRILTALKNALSDLDLRPVTLLLKPVIKALLADLLVLRICQRAILMPQHLDDVEAEAGLHRLANLTYSQCKGGIFKLLHHGAFCKPAQVATGILVALVGRKFSSQR